MSSSRNAERIAKCSTVVISSRRDGSAIQACSSRSSDDCPNRTKSTSGAGPRARRNTVPRRRGAPAARGRRRTCTTPRPAGAGELRVTVRPVHDPARDELGVGDDDGDVVAGHDLRRAHADRAHVPVDVADRHLIPDGDGALDEQDDARDEIAREVLEAEPTPTLRMPATTARPGEVDVERLERENRARARTA